MTLVIIEKFSMLKVGKGAYQHEQVRENIQIYSLMPPVMAPLFIFCYIPMYSIVISSHDYVPGSPFIEKEVQVGRIKILFPFYPGRVFLAAY
jgi:ABC-type polysaccharide transport system permease subunit